MSRRSPKLFAENEPPREWCLALADGTVRESLSAHHVREIVETGVASADSYILRLGDPAWQRLGDHPLWAEIAPRAPTVGFAAPAAVDPGVQAHEVHAATPKMQAVWQAQRDHTQRVLQAHAADEDLGRLLQSLGFACGVVGLICLGDIIVFTCPLGMAFVLLVGFVRLISLWLVWRILR